jgi:WD40 repeat protein
MQRISLRSTSTWEEVESVFLPGSWVWSVDFSPDGLWLTASSSHKDIQVWRTSDWKASYIINGFGVSIERAIFSPNGDLVIKLEGDTIRLWDFARQEQMGDPLTGHTSTVSNIAFSPDRWWLASGTTNGEVFLWGIPRWNTARTPTPDPVRTPTP